MPMVFTAAVGQVDLDRALADDRMQELRNLIALRQVGVEVILPLEHRHFRLICALEAEAGAHRLLDAGISLTTGSMPGIAASTKLTWLFGAPPIFAFAAPENSFDRATTCA